MTKKPAPEPMNHRRIAALVLFWQDNHPQVRRSLHFSGSVVFHVDDPRSSEVTPDTSASQIADMAIERFIFTRTSEGRIDCHGVDLGYLYLD